MTTATAEKTDIVSLVEASPVLVLTDRQAFSQFYDAMRRECDEHEPDLTTEKGRKAIASLAYKVARTKTAIDEAGKKLNEDARARINSVDEARREIRQQLDVLKDEVRRPLTEWEETEKQREASSAEQLAFIRECARVDMDATSNDVINRLKLLADLEIDEALHGDRTGIVSAALADTIEALEAARDRIKREEDDRVELERLREAEAERQKVEAERLAKEAEEQRLAEAEKAEAERLAQIERDNEERAKAEAERTAQIAQEAEARAKAEAERAAQEEAQTKERAHQEALDAERRRADEAERAAQAERTRIAKEEADRVAEADRQFALQRQREADREHRSTVMTAAKEAIMEAGSIEEAVAKAIVLSIAAGNVPNVKLEF